MEVEAFAHSVAPLAPRLKRVAYSILDDEEAAADVSQEALMRLWINRERLGGYDSIEAVAVTTARRIALDMLRKEGRMDRTICLSPIMPLHPKVYWSNPRPCVWWKLLSKHCLRCSE